MSKKSIKYTDVFNNPYNDYVCPTFPTCANSNDDDYYFEFIDKQSVGIVNNKATIQSMDLSDISSYVKSWSQETKVIQPYKTLFIRGEEYTPQFKKIVFKEEGDYPQKEVNKSYYFNIKIFFYDEITFVPVNINIPIYSSNYDLNQVVEYFNTFLKYKKIPLKIIYDNEIKSDTLDVFDTDNDGYVDVWWDGERHNNGILTLESTNVDFKFAITEPPTINYTNVCTAYKNENKYLIVNDDLVYIDSLDIETGKDLNEIIESMDGDDKDNEANIYWSEFNNIKPKPNSLIPQKFDKDKKGDEGHGFVDIVWVDEEDEEEDDCIGHNHNLTLIESVHFTKIDETEYYKYVNGAFKGITIKFKYPQRGGKYGVLEDCPEEYKYVLYNILPEKFVDNNGIPQTIYMDGPLYNGNRYLETVNKKNEWNPTSLMYLNVSNDTELIRGMVLYNPHNFPVAATYIKFN